MYTLTEIYMSNYIRSVIIQDESWNRSAYTILDFVVTKYMSYIGPPDLSSILLDGDTDHTLLWQCLQNEPVDFNYTLEMITEMHRHIWHEWLTVFQFLLVEWTTHGKHANPQVQPQTRNDVIDTKGCTSNFCDGESEPTSYSDNNGDTEPDHRSYSYDDDSSHTMKLKVTLTYVKDMLVQQPKLIVSVILNLNTKSAPSNTVSKSKFQIAYQKPYIEYGCELQAILSSFYTNFDTHNDVFPGGNTDKIQYAIDHLSCLVNYPDPVQ